MLRTAGGSASRLQLTKWAFLVSQETVSGGGAAFYDFLPYRYGPYSFVLSREISALIQNGVVTEMDKRTWSLSSNTDQMIHNIPSPVVRDVLHIMHRYSAEPVHKLLGHIYDHYPWFTINSRNREKQRQKRPLASPAVYTVGYEKRSVDSFLSQLLRDGIVRLIDVRANPVARRYGFHKSTLAGLCDSLHIDYYHFPQLGIPGTYRVDLAKPSDYDRLLAAYERQILPAVADSIDSVASLMSAKPSALLCQEADPGFCHRSRLADKVSAITKLPVAHLGWPRCNPTG